MTENVWPTAPVILARWREHGYTNFGDPATYFYDPATGDYISRYLNRRCIPRYGEFQVITEYVDAAQLEKRLDQIRQLENALRKKNAKLRTKNQIIKNLSLASGTLTPPRARILKCRTTRIWWLHINRGTNSSTYMCSSHADAIALATKKIAALNKEGHYAMASK